MSKVLLVAGTFADAKYFLSHVDYPKRKEYIVFCSRRDEERLRGRYGDIERAIFLTGWWRNWKPREANEVLGMLHTYGIADIWEQDDLLRRNYARQQHGLPLSGEPEFMLFPLPSQNDDPDWWARTSTAYRFQRMLDEDIRLTEILGKWGRTRRLSALPGLDDRKRTIKPFLGTFEDQYGEPLTHV